MANRDAGFSGAGTVAGRASPAPRFYLPSGQRGWRQRQGADALRMGRDAFLRRRAVARCLPGFLYLRFAFFGYDFLGHFNFWWLCLQALVDLGFCTGDGA